MTATPILETLAKEFSANPEHVQNALTMLDAGLSAPFIARFRRKEIGELTESVIRRLKRIREELEELDRRRGTILRLLEKEPSATPEKLEAIRRTTDRFELEDLFIPHRRPEPEVQLALDRGLGALADLLVASIPKSERAAILGVSEGDLDERDSKAEEGEGEPEAHAAPAAQEAASETPAAEAAPAAESAPAEPASAENSADEAEEDAPAKAPTLEPETVAQHPHIDPAAAMNAQLARVCQDFVRPDKGIHTESEALAGALRILSDRLGRDPRLRGTLRRLLGKHGQLSVRPTVDDSRLGRHRSVARINQPLRQIQGHRLIGIRQAQKERVVATQLTLPVERGLPRVRAALGRHTHPAYEQVLHDVALHALQHRLVPMLEADVRLELKERADAEALRFLSQHLRQILATPYLGDMPVAGVDVSAKGDWTIQIVDERGEPSGTETRIETAGKDAAALGAELKALLDPTPVRVLALGNGKGPRAAVLAIRAALRAVESDRSVLVVNEAGLSSYANSEVARHELPDRAVPVRMAISLARRLQDPLCEVLKIDPRHLGLGSEQGLVSKANARRVLTETIESCVAHVGCDLNRAPVSFLMHLPGLDREAAKKLVARRTERPFTSREELRQEGLLSEAQWASVIAFLRIHGGSEPLDATNLHPEQYPLVQRMLDSIGASAEQALGRPGATKGLRRVDFDVDEGTWRDLMREISFPGRDPRGVQHKVNLLDPNTDPLRLTKDRVVEGIVTSVSSFGCFVDVGLAQDAMVHISETSERYVRDAREIISVGETVRARILESGGQRLALSFKHLPPPEREQRPARPPREGGAGRGEGGEGGGRRGGRDGRDGRDGRGRGRREREEPPVNPNLRAAQVRRDGLVVRASKGANRFGGKGRDGERGARGEHDEHVRLDKVDTGGQKAFKPFASFFKADKQPAEGNSDSA
ncbi:MAG: S1 RNA-binding domain-containing protein [Planctomycetes bacterium]|nr:S1 RNA-binding domain-containing protein [Planctomycetota bacterium]